MFVQYHVSPLTIWLKTNNNLLKMLFFFRLPTQKNSSADLYNRYLQTTIIMFTRNVSSHKTGWILSESPLLALSFICCFFLLGRRVFFIFYYFRILLHHIIDLVTLFNSIQKILDHFLMIKVAQLESNSI